MQDFWLSFATSTIISILQVAVKNEETKRKIKKVMIKIHDLIEVMYPEPMTAARAAKAKKTLDEAA